MFLFLSLPLIVSPIENSRTPIVEPLLKETSFDLDKSFSCSFCNLWEGFDSKPLKLCVLSVDNVCVWGEQEGL